jgi:hypothetical protein
VATRPDVKRTRTVVAVMDQAHLTAAAAGSHR